MPGDCDQSEIAKKFDAGDSSELGRYLDLCWGYVVRGNRKYDPLTRGYNPREVTQDDLAKLLNDVIEEKGKWLKTIKDQQSPDAICKLEITVQPIPGTTNSSYIIPELSGDQCKK